MSIIINPYKVKALLPTGVVAQYKAENNTDDEGGLYNGTAGSQTAYMTGKVGQAFSFNGNALSKVSLPIINLGSAWSVQCWVRRDTLNTTPSTIFANNLNTASIFGAFEFTGSSEGSLSLRYLQQATSRVGGDAWGRSGKWYKATLTYDGSKNRLYVNDLPFGVESTTHAETFNAVSAIGYTMGGASNGPMTGGVDELTLYNTVLAPSLTGNLAAQYDCSNELDSAYTWDAITLGSPLFADGADGTVNGAWYFDGATLNGRRQQQTFRIMSNQWTYEMKIRPDTGISGNHGILYNAYNDNTASPNIVLQAGSTNITVWHNGSQRVTSTVGSFPLGTWTTLKLTFDNNKIRLYVNGALNATESGTHISATNTFTAGSYWGNSHAFYPLVLYKGRLDDIKIYNAVV